MSGLEIAGLCICIGDRDVVRAVDLHVEPGTCVGLVGESGSGKSLTALASVGLLPRAARVRAGRILLGGTENVAPGRDGTAKVRGSGITMIFQSPRAALNPVLRVGHQVDRVLRRKGRGDDLRSRTGMGVLLISHDLSVVAERCESISVMRQGAIVEAGATRAVIRAPRHPFTAELIRDLAHSPESGGLPVRSPSAGPADDSTREADE